MHRAFVTIVIVLVGLVSATRVARAQDARAERAREIAELEAMLARVDAARAALRPIVGRDMRLEVIDVRHLLGAPGDRVAPSLVLASEASGYRTGAGAAATQPAVGVLSFDEGGGGYEPGFSIDEDRLIELIEQATGEDLWDDPASIEVHGGSLIVHQDDVTLARIRRLLTELERDALQVIQVEVGSYSLPPALRREVEEASARGDGLIGPEVLSRLDRALARREGALVGTSILTALNEQRVFLHHGRERAYIGEYVQSAGGTGQTVATVADPIVEILRTGLALDVRPTVIRSGDAPVVSLDVRVVRTVLEAVDRRPSPWGPIDVPRVAIDSVRTSARVPPGSGMMVFAVRGGSEAAGEGESLPRDVVIIVRPRILPSR